MLWEAAQRIVVEQGDSSLLGPVLIAVGAVTAAVIAAVTAAYWQRAQLRHDREARDREHLRSVLGAATESFAAAVEELALLASHVKRRDEFLANVTERQRENPQIASIEDKGLTALKEVESKVMLAIAQMGTMALKLRISLPSGDPLVKSYESLVTACAGSLRFLHDDDEARKRRSDQAWQKATDQSMETARKTFERACLAWAANSP